MTVEKAFQDDNINLIPFSKGWADVVVKKASPNHEPRPDLQVPELIVIHSISLPPGEYGNGQIDALFMNELDWEAHPYYQKIKGLRVSSHFVIDRQGGLTQYVSCDDKAWHAGQSCWKGREACNDWSIGIELEGLENNFFEEAQYQTLIRLINSICACYPIRWIAGHEHISPGRKIDPGKCFNWQRLLQQVRALGRDAYPDEVQAGVQF